MAWHPDPGWEGVTVETAVFNEDEVDSFRKLMDLLIAHEFSASRPGVSPSMIEAETVREFMKAAHASGWRHRPVEIRFTDEGEK